MALIVCPECKKEVSDRAAACLHCGCPIGDGQVYASRPVDVGLGEPQRIVHEQAGSFGTGCRGGAGCVFGVVLALIALVVAIVVFNAAAKCQNCNGTGRTLGGLVECPQCKGRGLFGK